uniref:Uncharacterized protein n=1 Tax=Psychrobacter sp. (strain PRwf-1) TaxID=349106 RepID=A5WBN0_PSYWF
MWRQVQKGVFKDNGQPTSLSILIDGKVTAPKTVLKSADSEQNLIKSAKQTQNWLKKSQIRRKIDSFYIIYYKLP